MCDATASLRYTDGVMRAHAEYHVDPDNLLTASEWLVKMTLQFVEEFRQRRQAELDAEAEGATA